LSSLEEKENFNLKRLCERINELLKLEEDLKLFLCIEEIHGEMQLVSFTKDFEWNMGKLL